MPIPELKDLILLQIAQGSEGGLAQLLPYFLEGKEVPSEIKYEPLARAILVNLRDSISEMSKEQKDELLAAVILVLMGETQGGELRDVLMLKGHSEIKEIIGSLTALALDKKPASEKVAAPGSKITGSGKRLTDSMKVRGLV